jgi:general secretion pathway protein A
VVLAGFFTLDPFGRSTTNADQVNLKPAAVDREVQPTIVAAAPAQKQPDSLLASFNALLAVWKAPLLDGRSNSIGLDIDSELSARGFQLVRLAGDFEDLRKYNVPILIPLSEEQGGGYLAVIGQESPGNWKVVPAYQGRETLGSARLNALGMRMAMVPWVDFAGIGNVAAPGTDGENVRRLQFLLGLAGCVDVPTNGRYDSRSIDCVKSFQRDHGLIVDGLVGPRTLILIYQVAGAYDMPTLS